MANKAGVNTLHLRRAVFCLDCEVISNTRDDECPACSGHSLLNLARALGGSLRENGSDPNARTFDVTIVLELDHVQAHCLSNIIQRLTDVVSPQFPQGQALFHINVQPTTESKPAGAVSLSADTKCSTIDSRALKLQIASR